MLLLERAITLLVLTATQLNLSRGQQRSSFCQTPQNGTVGERGIIRCDFMSDYVSLWWFEEINEREAVIYLDEGVKGGYNMEEYDLLRNGFLIIKNVSARHDMRYKVLLLDTDFFYEYVQFNVIGTANLNVSQGATTALPTTLSKTLKVTEIKVTEPMGIVTTMEMAEETTETKTSMSKTETGPATETLKLTPTYRVQENQIPPFIFIIFIIIIIIFLVVVVPLASVIIFKRLRSKRKNTNQKPVKYNAVRSDCNDKE